MKSTLIPPARNLYRPLLLPVALMVSALFAARADERLFTYTYEAEVLPQGGVEFEQWLTHRRGKQRGVFSAWDFREEMEFGLTEELTSALYLNFRNTHSAGVPGRVDEDRFEFTGVSSEWKCQLSNPNTKPVGLLAYAEGTYEGDAFELEEKLVLQRNFGESWVLALNATVEEEWEFEAAGTDRELSLARHTDRRWHPHGCQPGIERRHFLQSHSALGARFGGAQPEDVSGLCFRKEQRLVCRAGDSLWNGQMVGHADGSAAGGRPA